MSYQVVIRTEDAEIRADAVVMDLAVHFSKGVDSIRLRSTETAVNGIRRHFADCEIYQGSRRIA